MTTSSPSNECRACEHFRNDPVYLEAMVPGLASLSSGHASVRGDDGICLRDDRHVGARSGCRFFAPRPVPAAQSANDHRSRPRGGIR